MKTSPRRRKHRRRAFRRLFWLLVLATLLLLLWPRRVTLDGLNSPHAILLQADSGEVLAEKDADSTIYPASMTKMMTALLAIEANPDLDTPVTLPEEIFPALQAQNASLAGFQPGETATVRDLLYGAMLPSGAECCEALAREVSGSEEAFAARMNQKAAELGMTATHFCNPTGLHDCWVSVKQFSKNDTATACQDWLRSTRLGRGSIKSHVRTVKVLGMGLFAFQERIHLWKGVTH